MTLSERTVSSWAGIQAVQDGHQPGFATIGLYWSIVDPFAVKATIRTTKTTVVWAWSRELLTQGLCRQMGVGDVQVRPQGDVILVRLTHGYSAQLILSATFLREFLARTYDLCPAGDEYAGEDIDQELHELLGEAA